MKPSLKALMMCIAAFSVVQAQTTDSADRAEQSQTSDESKVRSVESERGRLGMQRTQTETEIRAREEQRRLEEAQRAQAEAMKSEQASAPGAKPGPTAAGKSRDMSRTLEQLRSLGELKDDGYITEEEFQKIKQKILDSQI